ncbi:Hypothetical predicted protein [Octopus vulgaris]|uniref:Uncharacterized protein n=1 Tax=Octopus vulgaris TaxID=6645 RepID=A0AA36B5R5_OCTVU|nr:Hypothetical predicted protein [Octopus vulgaris]
MRISLVGQKSYVDCLDTEDTGTKIASKRQDIDISLIDHIDYTFKKSLYAFINHKSRKEDIEAIKICNLYPGETGKEENLYTAKQWSLSYEEINEFYSVL